MTDFNNHRSKFDSLKNCHYLISNSLGAMPNSAREWSDKYLNIWQHRGVRCWEEEWWQLGKTVGNKIGRVLNANSDTVTMQANVTSAQAVVLSCFDFSQKRNKVVMIEQEFPSLLYLYRNWLEDNGELAIVACPDGMTVPTEKLLDAIDESTRLVSISHVLFRSSYIVNVEAIIEKAHAVGAMVLLDIYQSIGTVPIDLQALNADFAVGGCLKWLCGGPGACFLYVKPDIKEQLKPKLTGWLAHKNPFAFDSSAMEYATDSYRFMSGTPAIPAFYICQAGLEIIAEIGVDNIRKRSIEMTGKLISFAKEKGWPLKTPAKESERGGTVSFNIPQAQAVERELIKRNFLVDYRPKAGLRVSPHFYNTDAELDDLLSAISEILS